MVDFTKIKELYVFKQSLGANDQIETCEENCNKRFEVEYLITLPAYFSYQWLGGSCNNK